MIRWAKRDDVFTSGVKLIPVEKNVDKMADREKMIEVINGWLDTDEQSSFDLADRLIEAGFGRVDKNEDRFGNGMGLMNDD